MLFSAVIMTSILICRYTPEQLKSRVPEGEHFVISPADGEILRIDHNISKGHIPFIREGNKKVALSELKGLIEEGSQLVVIFMKPIDKHITLSPIAGEITKISYVPGNFRNLYRKHAYMENEHNTMVIDGDIKVAVTQIAGYVYRRILCNVEIGDEVEKGDKLGRIMFGSAIAVILPKECSLCIEQGDKVKVGETVIAVY